MVRRAVLSLFAVLSIALMADPAVATPGDTKWTQTYDGPASGPDTPVGIAVDPHQYRVYVVGTTGNDAGADIVTIAFEIYTGDKIWARRYDGPAHGGDLAVAIAYDPYSGGVNVTGASESVAGSGTLDAVTISYMLDGSRRWVRRASSLGTDAPVGLVVDSGSTYVLLNGARGRLVAYDYGGMRLWAHPLTAGTLTGLVGLQNIGGYLMAVGTISEDPGGTAIFTTAFNSSGASVWTKRFSGPANDAYASDAAVGGGTILYVTGSYSDGTSRKITTIAYEPHDGYRFWRRSIAPQTPTDIDTLPHVAVADDGSSIAIAATSSHDGVRTYLTRLYNGDGSIAWTARENAANESGEVSDVAIGPDGNVYVAGQGTNSDGQEGAFTVAYLSTGPPSLFEASVPPANLDDVALCLETGPLTGEVFVGSRVGEDIRVDTYKAY
ncbi:MAG: PQQ-like beta-propeller repeat protein [Actinomycetota bacterium]|nr:PQQ-like beta-propeller repeat protein [Actinomycetota bacterium]